MTYHQPRPLRPLYMTKDEFSNLLLIAVNTSTATAPGDAHLWHPQDLADNFINAAETLGAALSELLNVLWQERKQMEVANPDPAPDAVWPPEDEVWDSGREATEEEKVNLLEEINTALDIVSTAHKDNVWKSKTKSYYKALPPLSEEKAKRFKAKSKKAAE